jgi:hypothetical protein
MSVKQRYSISVTGRTYARLREFVASGSLPKFIDGLVVPVLDDPAVAARVLAKCRARCCDEEISP